MPKTKFPNYKCFPDDLNDSDEPAFPSTNKDAILSVLDSLHSKIQSLDRERLEALSRLQNALEKKAPYINNSECKKNFLSKNCDFNQDDGDERSTTLQRRKNSNCENKNPLDKNNCEMNDPNNFSNTIMRCANMQNKIDNLPSHKCKHLDEFANGNILNSSSIKSLNKCGDGREVTAGKCQNRTEDKISKEATMRGCNLPKSISKDRSNLRQNKSQLCASFNPKIDPGICLNCCDKKIEKNSSCKGIYNKNEVNDTFVTLPEASKADISTRLEMAENRCCQLMKRFQDMNNSVDTKNMGPSGETGNPQCQNAALKPLTNQTVNCLDNLVLLKAENERLQLKQLCSEQKILNLERKICRNEVSMKNTNSKSRTQPNESAASNSPSASPSSDDCRYKMASIPFIVQKKKECRKHRPAGRVTKPDDNNNKTWCGNGGIDGNDGNGGNSGNGGIDGNGGRDGSNPCRNSFPNELSTGTLDDSGGGRFDNGGSRRCPSDGNQGRRDSRVNRPLDGIEDDDEENDNAEEVLKRLECLIAELEAELNYLFGSRDLVRAELTAAVHKMEGRLLDLTRSIESKILQISLVRRHIARMCTGANE